MIPKSQFTIKDGKIIFHIPAELIKDKRLLNKWLLEQMKLAQQAADIYQPGQD